MGIRVNKMLGYGLTNLKTRKNGKGRYAPHTPNDPRWDYDKYLSDWCTPQGDGDAEKECTLPQFLEWCHTNKDHLIALIENERGLRDIGRTEHYLMTSGIEDRIQQKSHWGAPYSAMEYDNEFGLRNVVLFTPAEHCHDWHRYDHTLDYYEEKGWHKARPRASFVPRSTGIWPHDGTMRRFVEPSRELSNKLSGITSELAQQMWEMPSMRNKDGAEINRLPAGVYNRLVGYWDQNLPPVITDPELLHHFREEWRPIVPMGVLALVEFMGCFPDAYGPCGIVNSLRPLIYVVWR